REGFEPSVGLPRHRFSRPAQSAALAPLRPAFPHGGRRSRPPDTTTDTTTRAAREVGKVILSGPGDGGKFLDRSRPAPMAAGPRSARAAGAARCPGPAPLPTGMKIILTNQSRNSPQRMSLVAGQLSLASPSPFTSRG